MRELVITDDARDDIAEADAFYEARNPGLGERFLADVQRCLQFILAHPGGFRRVHGRFRQAPLSIFPYVLVYRECKLPLIRRACSTPASIRPSASEGGRSDAASVVLDKPPTGATMEKVDLSLFGRGIYAVSLTDPEGQRHTRVVAE